MTESEKIRKDEKNEKFPPPIFAFAKESFHVVSKSSRSRASDYLRERERRQHHRKSPGFHVHIWLALLEGVRDF